jgi:hypothetical protein
VPRSGTPQAYQEIWAYLIVHHAISALTAKASAAADLDPDRISFAQALRSPDVKLFISELRRSCPPVGWRPRQCGQPDHWSSDSSSYGDLML